MRRIVRASVVGMAILASGCQKPAGNAAEMRVAFQVAPQPPRVGPATVTLRLTDPQGQPLSGATVKLEGNMSHPGMVPVFASAREREPGQYEASMQFTMGGDWFLLVNATLPDGRKLERKVDVPGVTSR
jgi:hypothetical protein